MRLANRVRRLRAVLPLLSAALAVALFLGLLVASFRESVSCRRGDLDYYFGIHEPVIVRFPRLDPADDPVFHWGCGDGTKRPDEGVTVVSRLPMDALRERLHAHLTEHGFVRVPEAPGAYCRGEQSLELTLSPEPGGARVVVWLIK